MRTTCVNCGRRIHKKAIGTTGTGQALMRWVSVRPMQPAPCPRRWAGYCIPASLPTVRRDVRRSVTPARGDELDADELAHED